MKTTTHTHPNAMWRSAAARLRSSGHVCPIQTRNEYGSKTATTVAAFGAILPTRREVPLQ